MLKGKAGPGSGVPGDQAVGRQGHARTSSSARSSRCRASCCARRTIPKWKKVFSESKNGDIWYPQEIRFFDEVEKANSTLILIKRVDLHPLEANLFTKAWLESKSR